MKLKDNQGNWTEEAKRLVWTKAPLADRSRPAGPRLDPCHALMNWADYGNRDSAYGWEIDHVIPEQFLRDNGVPQEIIDNIDNLRPMHWSNNVTKADHIVAYPGDTATAGGCNFKVCRDYCVNRDLFNVLHHLFADYIELNHPTTLGQWLADIDRSVTPTRRLPGVFSDTILTPSIHDLD